MAVDISGYGIEIQLIASETFPNGLTLTQFADDADPFDIPSLQIADKAMGVNGDLITWSKANPTNVTLNLIPNTEDDNNMQILFNINRVGRGKISITDTITLIATYQNGAKFTASPGRLTDGIPGNAVSSQGRMKSKPYIFTFENITYVKGRVS